MTEDVPVPLFTQPFRFEETHAAYRIVDAEDREIGVFVYWADATAIGSSVARYPPKPQARAIARAIVKALNEP